MRTRTLIGVLTAACALAAPTAAFAQLDDRTTGQRFVPGEALVRFSAGVAAAERREVRAEAGVSLGDVLRLPRTQLVSFDGPVGAAIERLEDQPGVAFAQPNYRYRALAEPPNDPYFAPPSGPSLWGLRALPGVDVLPAWDQTRGAGQVIAVLDTGVDLTHPDLAGNLWSGPGGIRGHDFVDGDSDPSDYQYHGTHVAGTAAAIAGNGMGVAGVAPEADIMAVRVLDGDGSGNTSQIAEGILFASQHGAGVINLSLGGPASSDPVTSNAASVAEQRGSVIVSAAGNGGGDGVGDNNDVVPFSPCNLPNANIICVAAVDNESELASYSNFGAASVDVGAPGGDDQGAEQEILSTKPAWVTKWGEDFTSIAGEWTASGGPLAWGTEGVSDPFASDSPAASYANNTFSELARNDATTLSGSGCRMRWAYLIQTADSGDFLSAGVDSALGFFAQDFSGLEENIFDASISHLDGQAVTPVLQFTSDASGVAEGAWVDSFRLACRGGTPGDYDNDVVDSFDFDLSAGGGGGSYTEISGTSMATPHAAGVAALVRAADPGAPPAQIVQAIKEGAAPLPSLSGKTVTGATVNALGAVQRSLAVPNPVPPGPDPPAPTPPGRAQIARVKVNKRGVITMVVRGEAGLSGSATLSANITRAARVMRVARRAFRIGATRRATVKLKLTKPALRQLRRKRKLRLRARIVLRNAAGLSSTTTRTARVRMRRR